MGKNEIIYGIIFILISFIFFVLTFFFPKQTIALSPAVFPRFVTVCLFILSSLLLFQGLRKLLSSQGESSKSSIERIYVIRFILLAAAGMVYVLIIDRFGFLGATILFIGLAMIIFGEKKWYSVILVSVITTVVLYGIFRMVFRVPLPRFSLW